MKTFAEFLEDVRWAKRLKKKDLASIMGVSSAAVTHYLNGKDLPNDDVCIRLALSIGDNPKDLIMKVQVERARKEGGESRPYWEELYEELKKTGTCALSILLLAGALSAIPSPASSAFSDANVMDIMSNRKARRKKPSLSICLA